MITITDSGLHVITNDGTTTKRWPKGIFEAKKTAGGEVGIAIAVKRESKFQGSPAYKTPTEDEKIFFDYHQVSTPSTSSNEALYEWLSDAFATITSGVVDLKTTTYANFIIDALAGNLNAGDFYLITDATKSTNVVHVPNGIPLIVQAVDSYDASFNALDVNHPQDIVEYNFNTDIILYRKDTINNARQYADWRNGLGLSISGSFINSSIGKGVSGAVFGNVLKLTCGAGATISNVQDITNVYVGNGAVIDFTGNPYNLSNSTIEDGFQWSQAVTADVDKFDSSKYLVIQEEAAVDSGNVTILSKTDVLSLANLTVGFTINLPDDSLSGKLIRITSVDSITGLTIMSAYAIYGTITSIDQSTPCSFVRTGKGWQLTT